MHCLQMDMFAHIIVGELLSHEVMGSGAEEVSDELTI
jgi:hypothetical protein